MIVSIAFVAATRPRANWIATIQRHGVILPVVLTVVLLATPLTNQRGWKKRFKLEQAMLTDVHVVLDETGWSGTIPDMSNGHVTWQAFTAALKSRSTFALILSTTAYIVPKSALTAEQIESCVKCCSKDTCFQK